MNMMTSGPRSSPDPDAISSGVAAAADSGLSLGAKPKPEIQSGLPGDTRKLRQKVALVTGGNSGIGRAVAVHFAREGANVALICSDAEHEAARRTKRAIEAEGQDALLIPGDMSDPGSCREAVERCVERFGRIDILVNNGAYQEQRDGLDQISFAQWEKTFRTNVFGYFCMTKFAIEHMPPGAAIINSGSVAGLNGDARLLDYAATKGAIHSFTKSLAQNLVERRVRVNCVALGLETTPLYLADEDEPELSIEFEEIARSYVYLASDADSKFLTGEVLPM
ncbi:General stress protein 39 [Planctomycetes bacterium Pan216]|uniref:General stress protein 39 n=1 Tax=Kolteria novifilia TaxID=2527975 RepID=A0A518BAE6_9BACT|nr:General stress protein 39 [Planctomycetes bacterium Pan216]